MFVSGHDNRGYFQIYGFALILPICIWTFILLPISLDLGIELSYLCRDIVITLNFVNNHVYYTMCTSWYSAISIVYFVIFVYPTTTIMCIV